MLTVETSSTKPPREGFYIEKCILVVMKMTQEKYVVPKPREPKVSALRKIAGMREGIRDKGLSAYFREKKSEKREKEFIAEACKDFGDFKKAELVEFLMPALKEKPELLNSSFAKIVNRVLHSTHNDASLHDAIPAREPYKGRLLLYMARLIRNPEFDGKTMGPVIAEIAERTKGYETSYAFSRVNVLLSNKKFDKKSMGKLLLEIVYSANPLEVGDAIFAFDNILGNKNHGREFSFKALEGFVLRVNGKALTRALNSLDCFMSNPESKKSWLKEDVLKLLAETCNAIYSNAEAEPKKKIMAFASLNALLRSNKIEPAEIGVIKGIAVDAVGDGLVWAFNSLKLISDTAPSKQRQNKMQEFRRVVGAISERTGGHDLERALYTTNEIIQSKKLILERLDALERVAKAADGEGVVIALSTFKLFLSKPGSSESNEHIKRFVDTVEAVGKRTTSNAASGDAFSLLETAVKNPSFSNSWLAPSFGESLAVASGIIFVRSGADATAGSLTAFRALLANPNFKPEWIEGIRVSSAVVDRVNRIVSASTEKGRETDLAAYAEKLGKAESVYAALLV
jgi:hypothetical protein